MLFYLFVQITMALELKVLSPDTTMEISTSASQAIYVEKAQVLQVRDQHSKIKLRGKKIGRSQLRIGEKVYDVWVVNSKTFATYQKLLLWQKDKRGPELQIHDYDIFISGRILRVDDWLELGNLLTSHDDFKISAQLSEDVHKNILEEIKEILQQNNLTFTHFSPHPDWSLFLKKISEDEAKSYKSILKPYGIQIKNSSTIIQSTPLIEVSVLAVEVQRSEMSRLGIQWPAATSMQALPTSNLSQTTLLATIHHLEENNKARTLAKPTLVSQSGEQATFHSGGEFPIKAMTQFSSNVVWKKYGLLLTITPRADSSGRMDIKVDCEFSMLDNREDESGVPGLLVHRVTSHINLEESKTLALSGLIKDEWRQGRSGLPGLLKIPLLHPLFSSESFQKNQSELIFFITPKVLP